jgi:hypothetical protein
MENIDIMLNLSMSEAIVDKESVNLLIPNGRCMFKSI